MSSRAIANNPADAWGIENGHLLIGFDSEGLLELVGSADLSPTRALEWEDFIFDGDVEMSKLVSGYFNDVLKVRLQEAKLIRLASQMEHASEERRRRISDMRRMIGENLIVLRDIADKSYRTLNMVLIARSGGGTIATAPALPHGRSYGDYGRR